jgi:hypothetical protein
MKSNVQKLRRVSALAAVLVSLAVAPPSVAAVLEAGQLQYPRFTPTIVQHGDLPPTIRIPIYATAPAIGLSSTIQPSGVPEPSSLMLALLGGAAVGLRRRPKSRRSS